MSDTAFKAPAPTTGGGDSSRVVIVVVVMMIAFAGGVMFLDSRLSRLETASNKATDDAARRQAVDSEALRALSVNADGFAGRADVAAIGLKQAELAQAVANLGDAGKQRQEILEQEVSGLRTQVNEAMAKIVDYRPLFEDLRQRQTRVLAAMDGMRSEVVAAPVSALPVPGPATSEPVIDLPPALADQVRRLSAADPAVRFEAVDVLAESKDLKVLPYMLPLAKDPDAFVRRLTVEGLREFRKPEAVDALIAALLDEDENVCDTAWRSLRDLTGQKFKFEASASKDARGRAARAWQGWWAKARATFGK
jgi:HEAT repeat protein